MDVLCDASTLDLATRLRELTERWVIDKDIAPDEQREMEAVMAELERRQAH